MPSLNNSLLNDHSQPYRNSVNARVSQLLLGDLRQERFLSADNETLMELVDGISEIHS